MAKPSTAGLDRRALFAATGLLALPATAARASDSTKTGAHQEPGECQTPRSAIARTQYGPVRGFVAGDVYTFKGVPYGQTTAGANRWLPAKPPEPWTEPRATLAYGPNCPQTLHDFKAVEMAQALARRMATAWSNFARTGDPSQPGLAWAPTSLDRRQTMVWDTHSRMVDDPEGAVRRILLD